MAYKKKTVKVPVAEIVTQKIIDSLEGGVLPWRKPWRSVGGGSPISMSTGKRYQGINWWVLTLTGMFEGYSSPYWGTFNQILNRAKAQAEKDGREILVDNSGKRPFYFELIDGKKVPFIVVRKGEKGTQVLLWKQTTREVEKDGEIEEKKSVFMQYFTVFNSEQSDEDLGLPKPEPLPEFNALEAGEAVIAGMPQRPEIRHGGNRAYYDFIADFVGLPKKEQFEVTERYYVTAFHELVHSTGFKDRIGRDLDGFNMNPESYSKEELIAELGASILAMECGISNDEVVEQSAAYVGHWLEKLKDDRSMIIQAASAATKAADFILGRTDEPVVELTPVEEAVTV